MSKVVTGYWTCVWHPQVQSSSPGYCPYCGLVLVFRKADGLFLKLMEMSYLECNTIRDSEIPKETMEIIEGRTLKLDKNL